MEHCFIMDNDSGYISHNQESTLDSSIGETSCVHKSSKPFSSHDYYLSEDTLLEKPPLVNRVDSFDSVINSSQDSIKTEFSGFEDSDKSSASLIIPEAKPIVWESSGWKENSDTLDDSVPVIKNMFDESDKENIDPSATPKKQYENRLTSDISPDLFGEEEELSRVVVPIKQKSPIKRKVIKDNNDKDVKMLKRLQHCLSGVHPPPSVTMIQMSVAEMLNKLENNKHLFWFDENSKKPTCNNNITSTQWPEILKQKHHGLHYNRSKTSEEFEHLCSKYAERYVGAETQSTCTVFESDPPSSSKRKSSKPRWMAKSPGRRLSHLARRRITFNSSSLPGTSSSILGSRARQILVDAKRLNMLQKKSPKKTPSKSPFKTKRNTPSSSAKKKLAMRFRQMSGEFENNESSCSSSDRYSFKRVLFNSPNQDKSTVTSRVLMEKKSTKRTLFPSPVKRSPQNKSPFKIGKRKRNDVDEENPSKIPRSMSDLRCMQSDSKLLMNRSLSDTFLPSKTEELSEQHKKKLQWAVYESLRMHNITASHPQFKVFASVLARVTRKFLPSVRVEGRTTEKMLRIARHHSYAVVKGKTVDEIVNEYMRNKLKNQKPQGYVGIEEFQNLRNVSADKENVLQDKANIIESIEKRREHAGSKTKFSSENRIDKIKKVISFEENSNKKA